MGEVRSFKFIDIDYTVRVCVLTPADIQFMLNIWNLPIFNMKFPSFIAFASFFDSCELTEEVLLRAAMNRTLLSASKHEDMVALLRNFIQDDLALDTASYDLSRKIVVFWYTFPESNNF